MSLYGCAQWSLNARSIRSIDVSMNKTLCHICSLPFNCHSDLLHVISIVVVAYSMYVTVVVIGWLVKPEHVVMIWYVLPSLLFHAIISLVIPFSLVTLLCLIINMSLANVITEIRDPALFVNGFVQYQLTQLVNFISTLQFYRYVLIVILLICAVYTFLWCE